MSELGLNVLPEQWKVRHLAANCNASEKKSVDLPSIERKRVRDRVNRVGSRVLDILAINQPSIKEALEKFTKLGIDIEPLHKCIASASERKDFLQGKSLDVLHRIFISYLRDIKFCLEQNAFSDHEIASFRNGSNMMAMKARNGVIELDLDALDEVDAWLVDRYKDAVLYSDCDESIDVRGVSI